MSNSFFPEFPLDVRSQNLVQSLANWLKTRSKTPWAQQAEQALRETGGVA